MFFFVFFRKIWLKVLIFCFSQKFLLKVLIFMQNCFIFVQKSAEKQSHFDQNLPFSPWKTRKFSAASRPGFYFYTKSSYFLFFSENFGSKFLFFVFFRKIWLKVLIFFFSHPNVEPQVFKEGGVLILTPRYRVCFLRFSQR